MSLHDEVRAAFHRGDNERTRELAEELRRSGHEIDGLCWLARAAGREGDAEVAKRLADEAREVARRQGDEEAERMPLHLQAFGARLSGDTDEARRLYLESIELNRRLGHDFVAAELHNLGYVELHAGNLARAKELFEEALGEARERSLERLVPYLVLDRGVIDEYRRFGYCLVVTFGVVRERALETGDPDVRAYYRRLERESSVLRRFSPYDRGAKPVPFNFDLSFNYYPTAYHRPGPVATVYRLRHCTQRYGPPPVRIPKAREQYEGPAESE
jgi:tetratricopeptide (TPR) repeat protein